MKKMMLVVCAFILLSMVGCSSRPHTFEIPDAAKITVISGNTGQSVRITDAGSIQYITDNINGLTYSRGEQVNSDGWRYGLTWSDGDGNEVEKVTVLDEYTIIYEGRYYKGMDADYEIDLAFLKDLFEES